MKAGLGLVGLALFALSGLAHGAGCDAAVDPATDLSAGWGIDLRNTRYQPHSRINASNVKHLKLKWVFGLATSTPRSQSLVTRNTIYVGDSGRGIAALDRETGCERWLYAHDGDIGSSIVPANIDGRAVLIFNNRTRGTFAIDATTGAHIWHAEVKDEPIPWYSGTPLVADGLVFVPVSSLEVGVAVNPFYGCCTTSGGMAAFDLRTGQKVWYLPTIEAEAEQTGSHWWLVEEYGPSGAAVWGAPSYDTSTHMLYFGTGQNYSHPTTDTSDALFAVHGKTGKVAWIRQFTANDAYTAACNIEALNHPNCADPTGPDVDFGAPTLLLRTPQGRQLLVAGQKSAEAHAVDPATGEHVWTTRLGRGGIIGGVHWGLAANEHLGLVYVPISDKSIMGFPSPGEPKPGLYALNIADGVERWKYARESRCTEQECVFGLSAGITATNDVVVAGSMDGYLEVLHARTGKRLWVHDAWQDYTSVNNVPTSGGAFDAHGPVIADDLIIVNAGYGYVGEQRPGNAMLVFQLEQASE